VTSVLPHLIALEFKGLVQTKEVDGGWKVRSRQHPEPVCLMLEDGNWTDVTSEFSTRKTGRGVLSLCDHLRLNHFTVLETLGL
jgi:hypothetical protein